jgi:lipopolysaccharide export system permease protein
LKILDRERFWAFLKAYVICYVSFVGLWIVLDAFSNVDEFMKRAVGFQQLMAVMGRYYLIRQAYFFDLLGSVISMMAAIFTVTWMQRANEQLAMLAAGISTHRMIAPVIISSILVSGLSVANQELIIPRFAEELQKSHDDDGKQKITLLPTRYDSRGLMIAGKEADRESRTIIGKFNVTAPVEVFGSIRQIDGKQATYIQADDRAAPLRGGWLVRGATISPPLSDEVLNDPDSIVVAVKDLAGFPPPYGDGRELAGDAVFLKTTLSFEAMTRKSNWYQYGSMVDLVEGLVDPATDASDRNDVTMYIHVRLLRPFLSLTLMFMTLPLVLGGYGRNMFVNLGYALGNSAIFYGVCLFSQYLGGNGVLEPPLAAWLPLFCFAMLATYRWGQIRT